MILGGASAQSVTPDYLKKLADAIKNAKSYHFNYKSNDIQGEVAIAKQEMYLSQKDHLEIYEKDTVRYSYNVKRKKVDIDAIKRVENGGAAIFNWLRSIDNYKIVSKEILDNSVVYVITNNDEKISVVFKSGVLNSIEYENSNIAKVKVEIKNFQTDKKQPSEYFTFDPSKRGDLEVTDYR